MKQVSHWGLFRRKKKVASILWFTLYKRRHIYLFWSSDNIVNEKYTCGVDAYAWFTYLAKMPETVKQPPGLKNMFSKESVCCDV